MSSGEWEGLPSQLLHIPQFDPLLKVLDSLNSENFSYLERRACIIRERIEGLLSSGLTCTIDRSNYTYGCNNIVFKVIFSDGLRWVARVPYSEEFSPNLLDREIETVRQIRLHTTIPAPEIYDFNSTSNSPFGFPYLLMEHKSGQRVKGHLAILVPEKFRSKVATQIAEIFVELTKIRQPIIDFLESDFEEQPTNNRLVRSVKKIFARLRDTKEDVVASRSSEPKARCRFTSSYEFYYSGRIAPLMRELPEEYQNEPGWTAAFWVSQLAITHFLRPNLSSGPFPLCHVDFGFANILFDEDYNITGVIDWTGARTMPFEWQIAVPEFGRRRVAPEEIQQKKLSFRRQIAESLESKFRANNTDAKMIHGEWLSPYAEFLMSEEFDIACIISGLFDSTSVLNCGKEIAGLMFKDKLDWETVVEIFGQRPLNAKILGKGTAY